LSIYSKIILGQQVFLFIIQIDIKNPGSIIFGTYFIIQFGYKQARLVE